MIIMSIIASLFGSEQFLFTNYFVLPFDSNNYTITSPYGERINPLDGTSSDFHNGIDVVPTSSNIIAIANGVVVTSEVQEYGGESVVIEHHLMGNLYRSCYHHLKENSRTVEVGDNVEQGQQVGIMGATGNVTGTHLHFSLQKFNVKKQKFEYIDPSIVFNNRITAKEYKLFDYDIHVDNPNDSENNNSDNDNKDNNNKYPLPNYDDLHKSPIK